MAEENPEDSVDITISNVVSHFSVRCHLNLRTIATNGSNVVYQREQSVSVLFALSVCCFVLFLNLTVSRIFADADALYLVPKSSLTLFFIMHR